MEPSILRLCCYVFPTHSKSFKDHTDWLHGSLLANEQAVSPFKPARVRISSAVDFEESWTWLARTTFKGNLVPSRQIGWDLLLIHIKAKRRLVILRILPMNKQIDAWGSGIRLLNMKPQHQQYMLNYSNATLWESRLWDLLWAAFFTKAICLMQEMHVRGGVCLKHLGTASKGVLTADNEAEFCQ